MTSSSSSSISDGTTPICCRCCDCSDGMGGDQATLNGCDRTFGVHKSKKQPDINNLLLACLRMNTAHITATHQRFTRLWHVQPPASEAEGLLAAMEENHRHNFLIWHEEDLARRDDLPERILEAMRAIDRHNQLRNDAIEAMDAALGAPCVPRAADAPVHSESPGMMLDGLSILALREYHLEEESTRPDANPEQRAAAAENPGFVREQRELMRCLEEVLTAPEGRRFFPFRACKLHNNLATNPRLYAGSAVRPAGPLLPGESRTSTPGGEWPAAK